MRLWSHLLGKTEITYSSTQTQTNVKYVQDILSLTFQHTFISMQAQTEDFESTIWTTFCSQRNSLVKIQFNDYITPRLLYSVSCRFSIVELSHMCTVYMYIFTYAGLPLYILNSKFPDLYRFSRLKSHVFSDHRGRLSECKRKTFFYTYFPY